MKAKVQAALDEIRPYIQADGGDVELVSAENGVVTVRLTGHCVGCPSSMVTLRSGIEQHLRKKVPEMTELVQAGTPEGAQAHAHAPIVSPFAGGAAATAPAPLPETVTTGLRGTHRRAEEVLGRLETALDALAAGRKEPEHLRAVEEAECFLRVDLPTHMRQEDEVLFPALIPFISWGSPMSVMAKEHRSLNEEFTAFSDALAAYRSGAKPDDLVRLGKRIAMHLRDDFYQEENVLFVEADESLTGTRAKALREAMERLAAAAARAAV